MRAVPGANQIHRGIEAARQRLAHLGLAAQVRSLGGVAEGLEAAREVRQLGGLRPNCGGALAQAGEFVVGHEGTLTVLATRRNATSRSYEARNRCDVCGRVAWTSMAKLRRGWRHCAPVGPEPVASALARMAHVAELWSMRGAVE